MKLTILAPALALCGGLAFAQNPGTTMSKPPEKKSGYKHDHKLTAEVVSADATAQQITVRKLTMGGTIAADPGDTPTVTLKVEGKALASLTSVKSGDMVTLSCRAAASRSASDTGASSSSGSATGAITSQASADQHCSSVTDISKSAQ
jgi:hypothetical protein